MIDFKCISILILLLFDVAIHADQIFFRGRLFDGSERNELRAGSSVQEKLFSQKLDHFNAQNRIMWNQSYHVNEAFYGKSTNSPIFLLVGGEGTGITTSWSSSGFWVDRAREHKALLFQLEHRFYGKSRPTENTSTENLQYLTVEQALEDAKSFMESMKIIYKLKKTNKWIVFGGSYPGSLSAWLRLKYPNLVYGVVSSSAPVQSIVDYRDYFRVVSESLGTYSQVCVNTITEAYKSLEKYSKDADGKRTLYEKFDLCHPLEDPKNSENDIAQLNNALANPIAAVVQYNKVDHSSNKTIDNICNILADRTHGSTSIDRYAELIKILTYSPTATCLQAGYQNFVNYYKNTDWKHSANDGSRQWFFQTCNQMGFFQSSSSTPHVFGNKFPVEHFIKQCTDVFGPKYTAKFIENQVRNTNNRYKGKDIVNQVDRVVFVQGSIDPWYPQGVLSSSNPKSPAIFIPGTAHCADMLSDNPKDLPQLIAARKTISDQIRNWLK